MTECNFKNQLTCDHNAASRMDKMQQEIHDLRVTMAAMVLSAGGKLFVKDKDLANGINCCLEIKRDEQGRRFAMECALPAPAQKTAKQLAFEDHSRLLKRRTGASLINYQMCLCGQKTTTSQSPLCKELYKA